MCLPKWLSIKQCYHQHKSSQRFTDCRLSSDTLNTSSHKVELVVDWAVIPSAKFSQISLAIDWAMIPSTRSPKVALAVDWAAIPLEQALTMLNWLSIEQWYHQHIFSQCCTDFRLSSDTTSTCSHKVALTVDWAVIHSTHVLSELNCSWWLH
jgi:hypothetical protein